MYLIFPLLMSLIFTACIKRVKPDLENSSEVTANGAPPIKDSAYQKVTGRIGFLLPISFDRSAGAANAPASARSCLKPGKNPPFLTISKECVFAGSCSFVVVNDARIAATAVGITAAHCVAKEAGVAPDELYMEIPQLNLVSKVQKTAYPADYKSVSNLTHDYAVLELPTAWLSEIKISAQVEHAKPNLPALSHQAEKEFRKLIQEGENLPNEKIRKWNFGLQDFEKFPDIFFVGYGFSNAYIEVEKTKINKTSSECKKLSTSSSLPKTATIHWEENEKSCYLQNTNTKKEGHADSNLPRTASQNWVYFENESKQGLSIPMLKHASEGVCQSDSGAPGFKPGTLKVLGVVVGGALPCQGGFALFNPLFSRLEELERLASTLLKSASTQKTAH